MKYLVDTCGWIEWLSNGNLADEFAPYLAKPKDLIIPTLLQFELYKWVCRERNMATALEVIAATERSEIVALDTNIALTAADMAKEHTLAMADAVIYATAYNYDALLITSDKHFKHFPNVKFFQKQQVI